MELKRKSRKRKIDLKHRIILVVLFIMIDIFLVVSLIRIAGAVNNSHLNNRFNELIEINFLSDDYDDKTSTTGKYKIVEKAMNDYFMDYSKKSKEILDIVNSDQLKTLLSIDNYSKDPKFADSLNYVNTTREDLDKRFDELYKYSTEEYIDNYISKISDDKKVKELFKKYMYSIEANNHFDDCNSLLKAKQDEVNNILDISKEVFNFLNANEGKWLVKDGQIQFASGTLKEQYDGYISRVK